PAPRPFQEEPSLPPLCHAPQIWTELRRPTHKIYPIADTHRDWRDKRTIGHPQNRHTGRETSHASDREILMNRLLRTVALFSLAAVGPARSADLSLRQVMLSSGGVGYF